MPTADQAHAKEIPLGVAALKTVTGGSRESFVIERKTASDANKRNQGLCQPWRLRSNHTNRRPGDLNQGVLSNKWYNKVTNEGGLITWLERKDKEDGFIMGRGGGLSAHGPWTYTDAS
jgi:hypothetical protein